MARASSQQPQSFAEDLRAFGRVLRELGGHEGVDERPPTLSQIRSAVARVVEPRVGCSRLENEPTSVSGQSDRKLPVDPYGRLDVGLTEFRRLE